MNAKIRYPQTYPRTGPDYFRYKLGVKLNFAQFNVLPKEVRYIGSRPIKKCVAYRCSDGRQGTKCHPICRSMRRESHRSSLYP